MRVVVTGGAGFIGSHVLEHLLARGDDVLVLDDLSSGRREHVPAAAALCVVDVAAGAGQAAARAMAEFRPEAVVHLAAQMDVGASVRAPAHDAHVNVVGTLQTLQAATQAGATTFVSASSGGAVYGDAAQLPTDESAPVQPRSPYGASKACSELYLQLWGRTSAMRCVSLRLGNVYGPRQSPHGEAGVVAIFAERIRRGVPPIIYGDGLQTRDFVYVGDVARAVAAALAAPDARGEINVGTGLETSVRTLAAALHASLGGPTVQYAPGRPGEVRRSCLQVARAARLLNWRAETSLAAGLAACAGAPKEAVAAARPRVRPSPAAWPRDASVAGEAR